MVFSCECGYGMCVFTIMGVSVCSAATGEPKLRWGLEDVWV